MIRRYQRKPVLGGVTLTGGVVAFAGRALTERVFYITKLSHRVLIGVHLAVPAGALAGGIMGALSRARQRRSRAVLMGLVLAVAATAVACGAVPSTDSSQPPPTAQSADPTESLLRSAAADFRAQNAPRAVSFRNVRSGYLSKEGVRQYRLCGEFLPASVDGKADWIPFATILTSPYEQWIGGQALHFCKDATMTWQEDDLSSRLLTRFKATE